MRTALYHCSAHLPESKLSLSLRACVICGGSFCERPIARIQGFPDVFLLHCPKCDACTTSRMPTNEALAEYYSNYYAAPGAKITHDSPARFARHIASFTRAPKEEMTGTDFGGGDGTLAYLLARILCDRGCASAEITVIDYTKPLVSQESRIRVRSVRPGSEIPASDIILASAVLEHIPDLLSSLTELLGALRGGGILYIRTPAVAGFVRLARIFGAKLDFTFPAHLHDLGRRFWDNVLNFVPKGDEFEIVHSAPLLVETDFRHHPWHTLAAHVAKAPWRLFGPRYTLVGGWEVVFRRK